MATRGRKSGWKSCLNDESCIISGLQDTPIVSFIVWFVLLLELRKIKYVIKSILH